MNKKGYLSPQVLLMEIDCRADVLGTSPMGWHDDGSNDFGSGDVAIMGGGL